MDCGREIPEKETWHHYHPKNTLSELFRPYRAGYISVPYHITCRLRWRKSIDKNQHHVQHQMTDVHMHAAVPKEFGLGNYCFLVFSVRPPFEHHAIHFSRLSV